MVHYRIRCPSVRLQKIMVNSNLSRLRYVFMLLVTITSNEIFCQGYNTKQGMACRGAIFEDGKKLVTKDECEFLCDSRKDCGAFVVLHGFGAIILKYNCALKNATCGPCYASPSSDTYCRTQAPPGGKSSTEKATRNDTRSSDGSSGTEEPQGGIVAGVVIGTLLVLAVVGGAASWWYVQSDNDEEGSKSKSRSKSNSRSKSKSSSEN